MVAMKRLLLTTLALIVAAWATLVVGPSAASASPASAATLAAANCNKTPRSAPCAWALAHSSPFAVRVGVASIRRG
jgi:hypothetical protein